MWCEPRQAMRRRPVLVLGLSAVAVGVFQLLSPVTSQAASSAPQLSSLSPAVVTLGQTVTFTFTGASFQSGAIALWSFGSTTSPLPLQFLSASKLQASNIPVPIETPLGTYLLQVQNPDGQLSNSVSLIVQATPPPPQLSSVSPAAVTVGQTVTFTFTGASFQSGAIALWSFGSTTSPLPLQFVSSVQLQTGQILVPLGTPLGTYLLQAQNPDGQLSNSVSLLVSSSPDTTPPTVSITDPANGSTVSGSAVTVSGAASDNVGVAGVQFYLDGAALGGQTIFPPYFITWDTTTAANGPHTLLAAARDAAGNVGQSSTVSVTVSNAAASYSCQPSDPPVKFLSQVLPPGQMSSGQGADVSITVANCSGSTWTKAAGSTGFKLGSRLPENNSLWGLRRVDLPVDLATNQQITLFFRVTAPAAAGSYAYQWGLLNEGQGWYQPYSPPALIGVGDPFQCPGADGVKDTGSDATAALQACVNATPEGRTLELPAGVYTLYNQVRLSRSITLRTAGTAGSAATCLTPGAPACAVFRAAPGFPHSRVLWQDFFGLLHVAQGTTTMGIGNVAFDHIVLDGNRENRLADGSLCEGDNNYHFCTNIEWFGDNARVFHSASVNALAATGFGLNGIGSVVAYNLLMNNGDHFTNLRWADGMTVTDARSATIMHNTFKNNSDVDFIFSSAKNASVQFNTIVHDDPARPSWAGMMLNNFGQAGLTDFTGADVSYNSVDCGYDCGFGLQVGPHPWDSSAPNLIGGYVHHNAVTRARQGINIDGAGTSAGPMLFESNAVSSSGGYQTGCGWTSGVFNLAPDSIVNRSGGAAPDSTRLWHDCTFAIDPPASADTAPPAVALTAPADGATVSGSAVTVSATASDNIGVAGVQFTLDGASLGAEDTTSPYGVTWNTTAVLNGSHTLTAVARDAAGNTARASITVTVTNTQLPAPQLAAVSPAAVAVGQTVTFTFTGANFQTGALALWSFGSTTSQLPLQFLSASKLQASNIPIPLGTAPGTYLLRVQNPDGQLSNSVSLIVQASPQTLADLVVTAVSGPTQAKQLGNIALTTSVANQGAASAGSFSVRWYLSKDATITTADTKLGNYTVSSLAPGAGSTATATVQVPSITKGTYYLGAIADPTNQLKETNEANNSLAGSPITIQ